MIRPTVGRVLWFWPNGKTGKGAGEQPHSAQVAYVHSDRCINIGYLDANGTARNATSVILVQQGEETPEHAFCEWMPYQLGQAARTEQAERGRDAVVAGSSG